MKITNIQNSQSFKGLNLVNKLNTKANMDRVIQPCIGELRTLAQKADITLELSSLTQIFKHFQTPRQTINIKVKPLDGVKSKMAVQNYSMFLDDEIIKNRSVLKIVRNAVSML